jgi:hypothetical protein
MPTTSFNRRSAAPAQTEAPKEIEVPVQQELPLAPTAAVQPSALSTNVAAQAGNDVQGDVNLSDLRLPRINLVQRTGELPERFGFGEFVLNKTCVLARPLEFIALSLKKQYQEKRPQGDTERGAVYDSVEQVQQNGGVIGYGDYQFSELAHIFMLIKKPDDLDKVQDAEAVADLFMYELAGGLWAPVIYSVGRSSYTGLAKPLITARQFTLRKGLWTGRWHLNSRIEKGAKGSWSIPVPTFKGRLSDEDAAIADAIRRGE